MNELNVEVDKFTLTKSSDIDNINIRVINLELFKSVSVSVMLMSGKTFIENRNFTLSGDDYKNWANDDNYLYTYVASKLGYTLQPTTVVPDPVVVPDPPTDPVVVADPVLVTDPTDPVFFTDPIL